MIWLKTLLLSISFYYFLEKVNVLARLAALGHLDPGRVYLHPILSFLLIPRSHHILLHLRGFCHSISLTGLSFPNFLLLLDLA